MQVLRERLPFDEVALLQENRGYLLRALGLADLSVHAVTYEEQQAEGQHPLVAAAAPGAPAFIFQYAAEA